MRETGPVGYRLSKASDVRYTGFARKYLGAMMNIHRELPFGRSSTRLLDGTLVTIAWNHGQKYIFISTEKVSDAAIEELASLFMESGLCNALGWGSQFDADMYYTDELTADLANLSADEQHISWLDWINLDEDTGVVTSSTSRPYAAGMPSLALHTTELLADYTTGNYATQSGKTLMLWQALAGTRDLAVEAYNGETIP